MNHPSKKRPREESVYRLTRVNLPFIIEKTLDSSGSLAHLGYYLKLNKYRPGDRRLPKQPVKLCTFPFPLLKPVIRAFNSTSTIIGILLLLCTTSWPWYTRRDAQRKRWKSYFIELTRTRSSFPFASSRFPPREASSRPSSLRDKDSEIVSSNGLFCIVPHASKVRAKSKDKRTN